MWTGHLLWGFFSYVRMSSGIHPTCRAAGLQLKWFFMPMPLSGLLTKPFQGPFRLLDLPVLGIILVRAVIISFSFLGYLFIMFAETNHTVYPDSKEFDRFSVAFSSAFGYNCFWNYSKFIFLHPTVLYWTDLFLY